MESHLPQQFRKYEEEEKGSRVLRHYQDMRKNQTLAYVERMEAKWFSFDHGEFTIREAFEKLGAYVDSSDPDTLFPNIEHSFQTAEAIRRDGHPDWFQLVGLIHDLGKVLFLWGTPEDGQCGSVEGPQWGLSGDTWVVGCRLPGVLIYPELNQTNPDQKDPVLGSAFGIYAKKCGLGKLKFAFGHDEYLYRVLKNAGSTIPEEGLQMIRLHSCYPLHQHNAYDPLLATGDRKILAWVKKFNKYDLYTKNDTRPNAETLWQYYAPMIAKYCPGTLAW
jgi:inositol oxygenase